MRNLACASLLLATAAWAGETLLGRIYVNDAGTVSNASTGYGSAGCALQTSPSGAGACDQSFPIGLGVKLTIQCDDIAHVSVNRATTDAGTGLKVAVDVMFPTSVSSSPISVSPLPDGGAYFGGIVSIAPAAGATSARCDVYARSGTE